MEQQILNELQSIYNFLAIIFILLCVTGGVVIGYAFRKEKKTTPQKSKVAKKLIPSN